MRVKLPLNLATRNYMGTIFGGSLYAAADPLYALMLIKILGPGYIVWDKAASILFQKPGRTTLYATFRLDNAEIEQIKAELEAQPSIDRHYEVCWVDSAGEVHARLEKTIYIRRKEQSL
jgi:acyl-coenzyme A thioesterase PaaI-like protein